MPQEQKEVSRTTQIRGLLFEMEKIGEISNQGYEKVDFDLEFPENIEFLGLEKNSTDTNEQPTKEIDSKIEVDIPLNKEGDPYIYEVKSYSRKSFGSLVAQRNQLLKYQTAVEQGMIKGATMEIKGKVDPNLSEWISVAGNAREGGIPDVEIIYDFPLPSGEGYRFLLKEGKGGKGVEFQNENVVASMGLDIERLREEDRERYEKMVSKFGNESRAMEKLKEDEKIIKGIEKATSEGNIIEALSDIRIENASTELQPFLEKPEEIEDIELFTKYEELYQKAINDRFKAIAEEESNER